MLMKHYNYNIVKHKLNPFCCRGCRSTYGNFHRSKESYKNNATHLKGYTRLDEYSPFKAFINLCAARKISRGKEVNIDTKYLKEIWNLQNGKCSYTGIQMILPLTTKEYHHIHSLEKASLDRIDSSQGYIRGNVEFVCMFINLAKNSYSKSEMINLISKIKNGQRGEI